MDFIVHLSYELECSDMYSESVAVFECLDKLAYEANLLPFFFVK